MLVWIHIIASMAFMAFGADERDPYFMAIAVTMALIAIATATAIAEAGRK